MQTRVIRVDPRMTVSRLIEEHLMASGQRVFPVEANGRFLGTVCLQDLVQSERNARDRLTARNVNQLPVLDGDELVGLLRREDVLKWLSLHEAPEEGRLGADPRAS